MRKIDLTGNMYGRLTVLNDGGRTPTGQVIWKCICTCGNIVNVRSNNLRGGRSQSCGCLARERTKEFNKRFWKNRIWTEELKEKWSKAHRGTNIGENNYNWKGGVSTKNMVDRSSSFWKECKAKVLKRDNYKCVICGVNNKKLQAHHLKSFSDYPKLRFDISNGVTICKNCHEEFHNRYGRKRFTEIDFRNFREVFAWNV